MKPYHLESREYIFTVLQNKIKHISDAANIPCNYTILKYAVIYEYIAPYSGRFIKVYALPDLVYQEKELGISRKI